MAIQAGVGARVGEYVLVRKLGEGGMAEVWLARHVTSAQLRAIKFLNQQFQGIPEVEARFQTEGESQLIHPNIVRIYQVGQETGSSYLVMQFIDGRDLEKILDSRRGPLTVPEAVDIAMQILAGLGFAHANGIIHRDIKPSNVLVDSEGQAYLMDFGIAKALRGTRSVTQVNSRLGTPDYMSPEQIRNPRDVDRRSDIYSFGCLFYELLTGWPPFDRGAGYETEHDIKTAHCTELPTPPVERKGNLPAELNEIALQCLAKSKDDRPQSCEEILTALDGYRASVTRPQTRGGIGAGPAGGAAGGAIDGTVSEQPKTTDSNAAKVSTGPGGLAGEGLRRETVVIPQATFVPNQTPSGGGFSHSGAGPSSGQPGAMASGGYGNVSRTPTVTDDTLAEMLRSANGAQGPGKSKQPWTAAKVQDSIPQGSSAPPSKGLPIGLIAGGSLLLIAALGGGVLAYKHWGNGLDSKKVAAMPTMSPSDGEFVSPKTIQVAMLDSTPGAKIYYTTDGSTPSANSQVYGEPLPVDHTETISAVAIAPGFSDSPVKTVSYHFAQAAPAPGPVAGTDSPPPIVKPKPPVAAVTGVLTWTGVTTSTGTRLTIVRSANEAWRAGQFGQAFGQLSGKMFPAGPVKIKISSGQATMMAEPKAATNYNTMDMYLPNAGQQTIMIHWVAVSNSQ